MKILVCFGTRPEAIKMAPICKELQQRNIDFKVCVTGQHREMLDQVLDFFEINADIDLNLMEKNQSLNQLSSKILKDMDAIFEQENPDLVLVHGDTTTSSMCAIAAFHRNIKVAHIEAGLRTHKKYSPFPEEVNRQLTSRLADIHFAPTHAAKKNLINELIDEESIFITGNTVVDALLLAERKLSTHEDYSAEISSKIDFSTKTILVTGHRRENFGEAFEEICEAFLDLANLGFQIVFPVHLNPLVREVVYRKLNHNKIVLVDPVSYPVFIWLMKNCDLIISDSGGIQEEAPTFMKYVLVTREFSERIEGVAAGFSIVVGHNRQLIVEKAIEASNSKKLEQKKILNPYGEGNASKQIVDVILAT